MNVCLPISYVLDFRVIHRAPPRAVDFGLAPVPAPISAPFFALTSAAFSSPSSGQM
eukprot:m.186721 g.186721  ORF g.186721 m.186721 type:complete len:56 (+) comp25598_c0_seq7:593-760(+)